jgi:hypothetical protein
MCIGRQMRIASPHSRYLLTVASLCVVSVCALVVFTTSHFYFSHSSSFWEAIDQHQFEVRGQRADILFAGDSALLYGISPQVVQQQTGWSAYNLGLSMPALVINHDVLLQRYLAQNSPPRLVVLYLSAASRTKPPYAFKPAWFEGETLLLRYGGARRIVDYFSTHDDEISLFIALAGRRAVALDWSGRRYRALNSELDSDHGHVTPPLRPTLDGSDCRVSSTPVGPDKEFIEQFRRDFARRGIPALVYLAPLPDCDATFPAISSGYLQVVDNVPYTLPHSWFIADEQRAHLIAAGARENSRITAAFLNRFVTAANEAARKRQVASSTSP